MKKISGKEKWSLLIAEIGGNHEGNFAYAKKLTKQAIDSVDVVKYQLYSGNSLVNYKISRIEINILENSNFLETNILHLLNYV